MCSNDRILIVDDNDMNRKMTSRLLGKLDLPWDEASDGLAALDKVAQEEYALILMDYRMPEPDGVETTIRIRQMEGDYYKKVPIIAMTADEREEMQEQFQQAGMNGMLRKPLQKDALEEVLNRWLSREEDSQTEDYNRQDAAESISPEYVEKWKTMGLDAEEGLKNCGEKELFESLICDFYHLIDIKCAKLVKTMTREELKEYTIEVHALKNCARLIGAVRLAEDFANLENLGNSGSIEEIKAKTPWILFCMHQYKELLQPFVKAGQGTKKQVPIEVLNELLQRMKDAVDSFDIDGVDEVMKELECCEMPGECEKQLESLKAYVADVALEDILNCIEEIVHSLEKAE